MKAKDKVILATDRVAAAIQIMARINYANRAQTAFNAHTAARELGTAAQLLYEAETEAEGE